VLRVALVNYTVGGVSGTGRHVALLRRGLVEMGIEAIPVTLSSTWHLGIPILRAATFTLGALLRRLEADVIHIHNPKLAGLVLRSPSRNVVTIHGGMLEFSLKYGRLGRLAIKVMRSLLHRAGAVTSVMKSEADRNGWLWVPNMTDLGAIVRIEPSKESYILFVGRNDPIKNYALFKRVMERIGKPYKALGVEEVASWERVISYMKAAECLVITSIWEGMPSVLLEAWASRCPVIAPDIEAFRPFADAVILAKHDVESYLEAYRSLGSRREEITRRGFEIVSGLDYPKVTSQYVSIYRRLVTLS
jgi:glycosyltransferase involved in cell wall biosynthesis